MQKLDEPHNGGYTTTTTQKLRFKKKKKKKVQSVFDKKHNCFMFNLWIVCGIVFFSFTLSLSGSLSRCLFSLSLSLFRIFVLCFSWICYVGIENPVSLSFSMFISFYSPVVSPCVYCMFSHHYQLRLRVNDYYTVFLPKSKKNNVFRKRKQTVISNVKYRHVTDLIQS